MNGNFIAKIPLNGERALSYITSFTHNRLIIPWHANETKLKDSNNTSSHTLYRHVTHLRNFSICLLSISFIIFWSIPAVSSSMIFSETFLRNTPSFNSAGQGAGSGNRRPKYPGKMTLYHLIIDANVLWLDTYTVIKVNSTAPGEEAAQWVFITLIIYSLCA